MKSKLKIYIESIVFTIAITFIVVIVVININWKKEYKDTIKYGEQTYVITKKYLDHDLQKYEIMKDVYDIYYKCINEKAPDKIICLKIKDIYEELNKKDSNYGQIVKFNDELKKLMK